MRKHIGFAIAHIGARLWENGGFWNEENKYENLTVFGKLGFNLFVKGLRIAGVTKEFLQKIV